MKFSLVLLASLVGCGSLPKDLPSSAPRTLQVCSEGKLYVSDRLITEFVSGERYKVLGLTEEDGRDYFLVPVQQPTWGMSNYYVLVDQTSGGISTAPRFNMPGNIFGAKPQKGLWSYQPTFAHLKEKC